MSKKTRHACNTHLARPLLGLLLSGAGWGCATSAAAQNTPEQQAIDQQRRAEQRQAEQAAQLQPSPTVKLQAPPAAAPALLPTQETPCFDIQRIELDDPGRATFAWLLKHADGHTQLPQPDPATGRCLGAQGVQRVIDRLHNALIAQGYVTSRILAQPQNLGTGILKLTLMLGQVHDIVYSPSTGQRASRWNTVPTEPGQVLKLDTNSHSAGNFAVDEMLRKLQDSGTTNAAVGTVTMFGSPVNSQDTSDKLNAVTGGQGTTQQATHVNDFVGTLFGGNAPTGGSPNTGALDAHSSYTGELTTSDKDTPQLPGVKDLLAPEQIKNATDKSWGFSQPVVVPPRTKPAQEGDVK